MVFSLLEIKSDSDAASVVCLERCTDCRDDLTIKEPNGGDAGWELSESGPVLLEVGQQEGSSRDRPCEYSPNERQISA